MEKENKIEDWEKKFEKKAFHWFKFSQRRNLWFYPNKTMEPLKEDIKSFIKQLLLKENMKIDYLKAPLNRYTFSVDSIREWVEKQSQGRVLNLFAGKTKLDLDEYRVDSNKEMVADWHGDAYEFVKECKEKFDTIILDPPYSYRKAMEKYDGNTMSRFNALKDLLPGILSEGGRVITFGYHSVSMGESRGFTQERILLMSHGGAIHDTIAIVEAININKD